MGSKKNKTKKRASEGGKAPKPGTQRCCRRRNPSWCACRVHTQINVRLSVGRAAATCVGCRTGEWPRNRRVLVDPLPRICCFGRCLHPVTPLPTGVCRLISLYLHRYLDVPAAVLFSAASLLLLYCRTPMPAILLYPQHRLHGSPRMRQSGTRRLSSLQPPRPTLSASNRSRSR